MMTVSNLKGNGMKTGLFAVTMMLSVTLVAGGMTSEQQLGSAVDDAVSATIHGGGCQNKLTGSCATVGACASTSIVALTGDGDYEKDTTTNCGIGSTCISMTKKAKKCDS